MSESKQEQVQPEKKSVWKKILFGFRVLIAIILVCFSLVLVFVHNAYNLEGVSTYKEATTQNAEEIAEVAEAMAGERQWMDTWEIGLWILVPWLCVALAWITVRKLDSTGALVILGLLVLIFLIAQSTNIYGVRRAISQEKVYWSKAEALIASEYADEYVLKDDPPDFANPRQTSVSYTTSRSFDEVASLFDSRSDFIRYRSTEFCGNGWPLYIYRENNVTKVTLHVKFRVEDYC